MTDWNQVVAGVTGPPIKAGTQVERTDVEGWAVGVVVDVTMTEAYIRFDGPMRFAWVKLTSVIHARTAGAVRPAFDQETLVEVERIIQAHIDKTHWAADAHRLKLALADIRKLATS